MSRMLNEGDVYIQLGAYLQGDLPPEECAAVETRLKTDPEFNMLSLEVAELLALLKNGERPVSEKLETTLRRKINEQLRLQAVSLSMDSLISASLTNDLSETEATLLQKMLSQSPEKSRELTEMKALTQALNQAQRPASDDLSAKLLERMRAKLPEAALRKPTPVAANVTPLYQTSSTTPSLRIYTVQQAHPWRSRAGWAAAAVAMLAVTVTTALQLSGKNPVLPNDPIANLRSSNPAQPEFEPNVLLNGVNPEVFIAQNPSPQNPPHLETQEFPEGTPNVVQTSRLTEPAESPLKKVEAPTLTAEKKQPISPNIVENPVVKNTPDAVVKSPITPTVTPSIQNTLPETHVAVAPLTPSTPSTPLIPTAVPSTPLASGNTTTSSGTLGVAANNPPPTPSTPPTNGTDTPTTVVPVPLDPLRKVTSDEPTNNAVVPVDGKAVVGMVLGSVEVKLPTGLTEKISQNKQLPSDVEITTGEGKTVLVFPDGGLLYINHASNLTVSFRSKKELTVVLNAGEVTYKGSGTLTLTKVNVSVRNGKEVNVKILGNRLTLNVLEGNSKLANAKNSITVGKDMSSSISLNSEDAATKPSAISTPLDTWRDDLKLPNESIRKNLRSIHKSTK